MAERKWERTPEEAYREAQHRIAEAAETKADKLDLLDLGLEHLPPEIGQLGALTYLDLSINDLSALPTEIGQLTALTILWLDHNQLSALPTEIGQLTALTYLNLSGNQFSALPPEIGRLTALAHLGLDDNQLSALPPKIGQLTALTTLDLASNQFSALPTEIGQLAALTHLYLSDNQLSALPPEIGQLAALTHLYLSDNQLSALPPEIGQLPALGQLFVHRNPLPPEILKLAEQERLISYLRELASARPRTGGRPRPFNEAKLLLVGPGEVGKTWLLRALQGQVPTPTGPTKGVEIAREPLDIDHPYEPGRVIRFNCWDFGGQDHYQITHQIFFSSKAIYLIVWKPRPGMDPDLMARLERIELSAGRSAKVFIVSTHADEEVPATLGQEAIRERFGGLIGGFLSVDSKKGPEGTNIARLKQEIAKAAAPLEGIDLPFPPAWHAARGAIRKLTQPTITFKEFAATCAKHGMSDPAALADIMHVLGHAVFFANAAAGDVPAVTAEENLIVLKPEWLAKAVVFVLEDTPTMERSGVLAHRRLPEIWKKDDHRGCPGYDRPLFGYLLWLMWQFDIAYQQDEYASLVPEMIQRKRPDGLLWTPAVPPPAGDRQLSLLCQIRQQPPPGLVPVLTAAVHRLRRRRREGDDDLDRNWREGFFLDTERRGTAFLELRDRDLHIVVRHGYPRCLADEIRATIDTIIKAPLKGRWPNLAYDFAVPCITRVGGKPCTGAFRLDYLEKRRGQTVPCQVCNADLGVEKMLEGFDHNQAELLEKLRELKEGQADLMAVALKMYRDVLDPARPELERCPCMFTILPSRARGWKELANLTSIYVNVTCWCEHPDGPHPAAPIFSRKPPDYELTFPRTWLVKAAPYISWAAMLFKAIVPVAGKVIAQGLGGALDETLEGRIELMGAVAEALPDGKLEVGERTETELTLHDRPEIVTLRHIHDALMGQVKPSERWGDLRPVRTKTGQLLWLCAEHAAIQQPPVLHISA